MMKRAQSAWALFQKKTPRKAQKNTDAAMPLTAFTVDHKGEVAYLQTKDSAQMRKLMSIGIVPGMPIRLEQKFPSYVIVLGQAYFAVDKELASAIFVRAAAEHKHGC